MTLEHKVRTTLNTLNSAIQDGNAATLRQLLTSDGCFIATDDSEKWDVDEACFQLDQTQNKTGRGWRLRLVERRIRQISPKVWTFYEHLQHPTYGHMRATGVCVLDLGDFVRVSEYVLSFLISDKAVDSKRTGIMLELISDQPE